MTSRINNMASRALRLGQNLKELRIHLCQKSPASQGVRDFIEQHYVSIKKDNPKFPILVRECSGTQPRMWARYAYGQETSVPLENLNSSQVLQTMESLAKQTTA